MSDLATLQHNNAFSPRNYSPATSTSPSLHYNSLTSSTSSSTTATTSPFSNQPHHRDGRSSSIPDLLVPHTNGRRRTRRLSTPTEERKEQRKQKDSKALSGGSGTEQRTSSSDDLQLHVTTDIDADEHQWLLASAAANQRAAAQLTAEAELCPLLIEPQQLIASSEDDMSPLLSSSPTLPARRRVVDLVSSYEQLSFIRFPPRLTSLAVARSVWAAVGLMEVGWVRGHEGETGSASVWVNVVRGWQACWLVLCLCALTWSVAAEWAYDVSVPQLDRVLLAACWCVSVIAAVLLSHRILSHRLIGTRLYHLYHNAHPPRSSLPAINHAMYSSLLGLLVLFVVGLYADLFARPPPLPLADSGMDDAGMASVRSSLWYACICLLRLQLAAGVSLVVCLLDVHRQRVEQSRAVLTDSEQCGTEEEDAIYAHLLDVQLCVADVSDSVGTHVAAIVAASTISALVTTLCAVTAAAKVHFVSLLCPLLLAMYVLIAAARLNQVTLDHCIHRLSSVPAGEMLISVLSLCSLHRAQACSRLHSAVAVLALQPSAAAAPTLAAKSASGGGSEGGEGSAAGLPRSSSTGGVVRVAAVGSFGASLRAFCWHHVSFDACGVRVGASVVCVFALCWCGVLLWLMQTEHGR